MEHFLTSAHAELLDVGTVLALRKGYENHYYFELVQVVKKPELGSDEVSVQQIIVRSSVEWTVFIAPKMVNITDLCIPKSQDLGEAFNPIENFEARFLRLKNLGACRSDSLRRLTALVMNH